MRWTSAVVTLLLTIFLAELLLSVRQNSQTFDESAHIYAGYSYWKRGDFGINPEHPPLVKLVATVPLLSLDLPVQPPPNINFRGAAGLGGLQFLYSHDADALLFRARAGASLFGLALALLVFFATKEMFGSGAAVLALVVLVLEPVILANSALITTDIGLSACLFAAVYFFYRYAQRPSVLRLIVCGVVSGLTLAAKHSGLIILPLLALLATIDFMIRRVNAPALQRGEGHNPHPTVLRTAGAWVAISAIAIAVLWSFYGFRYAARPANAQMSPPTAAFLQVLQTKTSPGRGIATVYRPREAHIIGFFEQHHLLPEAYLYGLTDVATLTQQGRPIFLLGKVYPRAQWFYFPVAFAIKTTLALIALLFLMIWASDLRRPEFRRAVLFIAAPPVIFLAVAVNSKLQMGIRHFLPVYPFLIVLAGVAAWSLSRQSRRWAWVVAILLAFDAGSSLRAFPNYLPYSNEVWGGVPNTHKFLSDSNVGWRSGLKVLQSYVADHRITNCWFAYDALLDPAYYHIPCRPLPTLFAMFARARQIEAIPEHIEGPLFFSAEALDGFDFGPGQLNPYQDFVGRRPDTVLQGEILVFNGSFDVTKAAALSHFIVARRLSMSGHPDQAIFEAKAAVALDPDLRPAHELLASLYFNNKQADEARGEYYAALRLYQTVEPEFQAIYGPPENPFAAEMKTAAARIIK